MRPANLVLPEEGAAAEEVALTVDAKTMIMVDGQASVLSKLKVGDKVRGAYSDAKVAIYVVAGKAKAGGEEQR